MKLRTWIASFGMIVLIVTVAFAGMAMTMRCKNCGFSSRVNFGGGFRFEQVTGYCVHCEKFVYLSWKRGEEKPGPLSEVWDSSTGKTIPLYKCPQCSKPFMLLQSELKHCPKCGKPTLERDQSAGTIMYD